MEECSEREYVSNAYACEIVRGRESVSLICMRVCNSNVVSVCVCVCVILMLCLYVCDRD